MKQKNRVLLIILISALLLIPGTAFAADIIDSGTCGDNATWTLNIEGVLTISGSGAMYDFNVMHHTKPYYRIPWGAHSSLIKKIVIEENITHIGVDAFEGCSNLTSVTIPNTVTSIGTAAFWDCTSLASITIPDSVTSLGGAFSGCTSLTSITIPSGVTSIDGGFFGCTSLTSITIPDTVTSIGDNTFNGCSNLKNIVIPKGVTSIGEYAFFGCSSLTSITIPNGITSIGPATFAYCKNLTNVTIPNGVTSIGSGAFNWCSSLTDVMIPESVSHIDGEIFVECDRVVICGDIESYAKTYADAYDIPFKAIESSTITQPNTESPKVETPTVTTPVEEQKPAEQPKADAPAKNGVANPTASTIYVDGEKVAFEAYNINGNNYFKLRDVAWALSGTDTQFNVAWNEAEGVINLISGEDYGKDGALSIGNGKVKSAVLNSAPIMKDGAYINMTAYNIEGNNFFKLRDLGEQFGFEVGWDGDANAVTIDTDVNV